MTTSGKLAAETAEVDQETLVQECLKGNERAWSALIDRYKNLIFSIPIKYGFSPEDATDIFQAVCLALFSELSSLREPRALGAWLIRLTSHKCLRWKTEQRRYAPTELRDDLLTSQSPVMPERILRDAEEEQILREAVAELAPNCKRLVELLFYKNPPLSYDEIAKTFGMPRGSIGATRMRCLEKLRKSLESKGF